MKHFHPLITLLSVFVSLLGGEASASSSTPLSREKAAEFLYSILSLPDSADYSRKFYDDNIEASFRAREEMPWGKIVPDREFLHFVIPVRVNNENLDMSRPQFYEELKDRVKGLSMKDAILEVNHWCHEKVTYRPSDARTSSPFSSVSQAIGRCGEESTFTVAALRSVGIPARQIYTPRWAHTDDNHAWVEAWAEGQWFFLGACEPEPVLDLAWFNDPASRGLLMSTNVAGHYQGDEEVLLRDPLTTRINVTSKYAPVGNLQVRAIYPDGTPASGANINFCIYNYAEFYPAVKKTADANGRASLTAGLGDMLVWVTDGSRFGYTIGRPGNADTVTVTLDKDASFTGASDFDIVPPPAKSSAKPLSESQKIANAARLHREDSIRNAYTSSFPSPEEAGEIASRLQLDSDSVKNLLLEARGNHESIVNLLSSLPAYQRGLALNLLMNVSEKDRRDISMEAVKDHIAYVVPFSKLNGRVSRDMYDRYILNPRIENEGIRPWRSIIREDNRLSTLGNNPKALIEWIDANITVSDSGNPQQLRMSPGAVLSAGKCDPLSRNIFFVAAARTLGIPARIDPVTGTTQYYTDESGWTPAVFKDTASSTTPEKTEYGSLSLSFSPEGYMVDPKYYSQFSLSKITDGMPRQLEFDENGTVASIFANPIELEAGQYIITSGRRLADGGVLARSEIFTISPGKTVTRQLKIRNNENAISVIGALNAENIYHDIALGQDKSILSSTGRGYYVIGFISPNHEPSAHALNDLSAVAKQMEETGVKIMLLFADAESAARFIKSSFGNLPSNVVFGIDNEGVSRKELLASLNLDSAQDPVFAIADTFNRVVWVSSGYTIGIGDPILSILSTLK